MTAPVQPVPPSEPTQRNTPMCPSFVGARVARITRLNSCGAPMYGPDNVATTIGMVTVTFEPEVSEGDSLETKNLNGELCVSASTPDSMTGINVSIEFCQVDPAVFTLLNPTWKTVRNSYTHNRNAPITGFRIGQSFSDECGFALELWPKAMGAVGNACDVDENPDPSDPHQVNGYFLLPYVTGKAPEEWEITGDEVATFTLNGRTRGGSAWGHGPYIVTRDPTGQPSPLLHQIEDGSGRAQFPDACYGYDNEGQPVRVNRDPDHFHAEIVTYAPPEARCGAQALTKPVLEFVDDGDDDPQTITVKLANPDEVAPADANGNRPPVWVSFGDGTPRVNITKAGLDPAFTVSHTYAPDSTGEFMIRAVAPNGVYDELVGAPGATLEIATEGGQFEMPFNSRKQLTAKLSTPSSTQPKDVTVMAEWSSGDTTLASVGNRGNAKGKVRSANKAGTVSITAAYGGLSVSKDVKIVPPKIDRLVIEPASAEVTEGDTGGVQFQATAFRADGTSGNVTSTATWGTQGTPDDATVAIDKGKLTCSAAGASESPSGEVTCSITENDVTTNAEPASFTIKKAARSVPVADENNPHTVALTLHDAPDGVLTAEWGDGTSDRITGAGPHRHTYADDGTYTVVVRDENGAEITTAVFTAPQPASRKGKR